MDWNHDVHDWLGGYPYESTRPLELARHVRECGLCPERVFENCAGAKGFFGTGCDEYVARRPAGEVISPV
jgi:2-polyprenyl-6-hydroxyphenyl methylase/3-demethylubiquinone-9 3-methyltransferase